MKHTIAIALLATAAAHAGMLTDPVTSSLTLAGGGSWTTGNSATVGPGIEFTRQDSTGGFTASLTLDIANTSFTLADLDPATSGTFALGMDAFQFTDLNQTFAGISLEPGNTFPAGTFTSATVSAHTIEIFTDEPVISSGNSWSATWDVTFANPTPEPESFALMATGLALLLVAARRPGKRSPSDPQ